jgi:tRNA U34 5-methylaminomethyl-2-thiouridine-forming methyltransferase MnmC
MIQILETSDGSQTLYNDELDETYHSKYGAVQESMFVFIEYGFRKVISLKNTLRILDVGFGTGLNALLSLRETSLNPELLIDYVSLEPFPLSADVYEDLRYADDTEHANFLRMHQMPSGEKKQLTSRFAFTRLDHGIENFADAEGFDLVYYDAFGPASQPELWTTEVLKRSVDCLTHQGVWVTYCCKGDVRRSLISLGLSVSRVPGPPGKRHMLFAIKSLL